MNNSEYTDLVDDGQFPTETEVPLDPPFRDERGTIQNLVLKPITSVAIIHSRKGSIRANHVHATDFHYSHIVSGAILYFEREIGSKEIPEPQKFTAGQMFFTPPGKEHSMLFAEDTVFITMARNVRSHTNHESDLTRVEFITPEIAETILKLR